MSGLRANLAIEIAERAGVEQGDIYRVDLTRTDTSIEARITFSSSVPPETVENTRVDVDRTPVIVYAPGTSEALTSDSVSDMHSAPTAAPPTPAPTVRDGDISDSTGSSSDSDENTITMLIILIAVVALLGIVIVIVIINKRKSKKPVGRTTVYTNPVYGTGGGVQGQQMEMNTLSATPGKPAPGGLVKVESMC